MRRILALGLIPLAIGGCPNGGGSQAGVTARIGVSATTGEPPLTVVVSATSSTSTGGAIARVMWDFAGQATSEDMTAQHTFTKPGLYPVRLLVVDEAGEQGAAQVDVRVRGGPATAVLEADPSGGTAPLVVRFDASSSAAEDDVIRDYYWDFGDGDTSRSSAPVHLFEAAGEYAVTLRVVSAGGVEDSAQMTIPVEGDMVAAGSLQFNGAQFVLLPIAQDTTGGFALDLAVKPSTGGSVATFGSPQVAVELAPAQQVARLRIGGVAYEGSAAIPTDRWSRLSLRYAPEDEAVLSLDGAELISAPAGGAAVTQLVVGTGFAGNIADVGFSALTADGQTEIGRWPLNDGSGQSLGNLVAGGSSGTLGATPAAEASDPAWNPDGP